MIILGEQEGTQPYIYMCPFSMGVGSDVTVVWVFL